MSETISVNPRRRIPRWAWITVGVVAFLVLLFATPYIICRIKLNAEYARIRAEGYPVTPEEIEAWYPYPVEGQNAADVYAAAFSCYDDTHCDGVPYMSNTTLPPLGNPVPPEMKAAIAIYLRDNAKALELLHKAAAIPACRWPINARAWPAMTMNHLVSSRQGARLLKLEAEQFALEGKGEDAAASIRAGLRLGASLENEPLFISLLVGYAAQAISIAALERVLSQMDMTDAALQDIAGRLAARENLHPVKHALIGERVFSIAAFNHPSNTGGVYASGPPVFQSKAYILFYRASGMRMHDELEYLRLLGDLIAAADCEPLAIREQFANVNEKYRHPTRMTLVPPRLTPTWENAAQGPLSSLSRLRTARVGVEAMRFKATHGKLPVSLDELVPQFLPKVPQDPFDGIPLRYRRTETGFVVYSVGPNLMDDEGREDTGTDAADDLTFTVGR